MPNSKIIGFRLIPQRSAQIATLEAMTGLSGPAAVIDLALATTLAHYQEEDAMEFTIDDEKLAEVVRIFQAETDEGATQQALHDSICYDWPEAEEHQAWLDVADAQEIADWLAAFHVA